METNGVVYNTRRWRLLVGTWKFSRTRPSTSYFSFSANKKYHTHLQPLILYVCMYSIAHVHCVRVFLHIDRSGLNHTQHYTRLVANSVRTVVIKEVQRSTGHTSQFGRSVETRRRYGWLRMDGVPQVRAPLPSSNLVPFRRWWHARGGGYSRGEPGSALSGGYVPYSARAEGSSIVDEPGECWTPVR